jgi:predicted dehydrogenase
MVPLRIGIIGFGKIAKDQHVPSILANDRFAFVAASSPRIEARAGLATYADHREMIARAQLDAVAICTPPDLRYEIARDCLEAGLHTLLEKPPGVTLGEVEVLDALAAAKEVTLFTAWHAQYNPAVASAADLLAGKRIAGMTIVWKEDVRKWHPGQQWIWRAGGFGVFDPGINALSIVTRIFPGQLVLRSAALSFPANRQAPIAADLLFTSPASDGPLHAAFDWRHGGGESWTIEIRTTDGLDIRLEDGGARLMVGGEERGGKGPAEYAAIYARFLDLIDVRQSLVDVQPLRLAADAFLAGSRTEVEPFDD